jgi:UDP-glucose 4-epimerase
MRVLVTGGAGFIGSNLARALVADGHSVLVIDDLSTGKRDNLPGGVALEVADILGLGLPAAFAAFGPEAVVHLAAQTDVTASIADPERDRAMNVDGTRLVAAAAAAAGARLVLSASSAAVYGEPAELPLREGSPKRPANPYGASKLAAEAALARALDGSGADFASLRFSNVYGPRQDWRGEGGVVAIFAGLFARSERPTLYGTGDQTRDFIFVEDVVGAVRAALVSAGPLAGAGADGAAYNVSTGVERSVADVVGILGSHAGTSGGFERAPARDGDVDRSVLDPAKARGALSWSAETRLEEGLAETWKWFREST